jgi:hypothetical protein
MINIFLKSLPYLIVIGLIVGIFWYGSTLKSENQFLLEQNTQYCEIIKQNEKKIEDLQADFNMTNKELEILRKNEQDAKKYLNAPELKIKIDSLINEADTNKLVERINNYQACLIKQFDNPTIDCLIE